MSSEFLLSFKEFLGKNGWQVTDTPWDVIERWEQFVDACSSCYQWGIYEFDDEVRVRTLLDRAFSDPQLIGYPQITEMRERVTQADARFRNLLSDQTIRDERKSWWLRAVLARAGDEYRDDAKRVYSIDVLPC
jgi:hypothetical protein